MERYHIFKLGLAILFYAAYCIRPMLVNGLQANYIEDHKNNRSEPIRKSEDFLVYYQGVEGTPGIDFPIYSHIPRTAFSCKGIDSGYYADLDTDCQVFHICEEEKKISFLCPNGTIFQQSDLICEWWFKVNCTDAPNLYEESAEHLRADEARRKALRKVHLNGQERNHGAVMRTEEASSVTAQRNGKHYEITTKNNYVRQNLPQNHKVVEQPSYNQPRQNGNNAYQSSNQYIASTPSVNYYDKQNLPQNHKDVEQPSYNQPRQNGNNAYQSSNQYIASTPSVNYYDKQNLPQNHKVVEQPSYNQPRQNGNNAYQSSNQYIASTPGVNNYDKQNLPQNHKDVEQPSYNQPRQKEQNENNAYQSSNQFAASTPSAINQVISHQDKNSQQTPPSNYSKNRRYNDDQTGNYLNNDHQDHKKRSSQKPSSNSAATTERYSSGRTHSLKEYHVQFSATSPGIDRTASESHYSTTAVPFPNSITFSNPKNVQKGNRGGVRYNTNIEINREADKSSDEYELQFPKHQSEYNPSTARTFVNNYNRGVSTTQKPINDNKYDNQFSGVQEITKKKLDNAESDESQITQESASFVKNSFNSIQEKSHKYSTPNPYPNHRTTYSDLKQPNFTPTKYSTTISSVTPQYITTQPINNGKPFIGSRVGANIHTSIGTLPLQSNFSAPTTNIYFSDANASDEVPEKSEASIKPTQNTFSVVSKTVTPSAEKYNSNDASPTPFTGANTNKYSSTPQTEYQNVFSVGSKTVTPSAEKYNSNDASPTSFTGANINKYSTPQTEYQNTFSVGSKTVTPSAEKYNSNDASPTSFTATNTNKYSTPQTEYQNTFSVGSKTVTPSAQKYNSNDAAPASFTGTNTNKYNTPQITFTNSANTKAKLLSTGIDEDSKKTAKVLLEKVKISSPSYNSFEATVNPLSIYPAAGTTSNYQQDKFNSGNQYQFNDNTKTAAINKFNIGSTDKTLPPVPVVEYTTVRSEIPTRLFNVGDTETPNLNREKILNSTVDFNLGTGTVRVTAANTATPLPLVTDSYHSSTYQPFVSSTLLPVEHSSYEPFGSTLSQSSTYRPYASSATASPIQSSSYRPFVSSFTQSPIESSTKRIVDHATVYGSFSRNVPTTSIPSRFNQGVPIRFDKNADKVNVHLAKSVNGDATPKPNFSKTIPVRFDQNDNNGLITESRFNEGVPIKFDKNANKVGIHLSKSIGSGQSSVRPFINLIQTTPSPYENPKYGNSVNPPLLKLDAFVRTSDLQNTLQPSTTELPPPPLSSSGSSYLPLSFIEETGKFKSSVQPPLLDVNTKFNTKDIHKVKASTPGSGFFVTKNSIYDSSTALPLSVAVSPNSYFTAQTSTQRPRPFEKLSYSGSAGSTENDIPVTPTYVNYKISSASPFKLRKETEIRTPQPTLPTPYTTPITSPNENVDKMISILKKLAKSKQPDYSSETPRPGLLIPPSVGPQTLHTLAVYFANALDGVKADKEKLTEDEKDEVINEKLTSLLTEMTMHGYAHLFNQEEQEDDEESSTAPSDEDENGLEVQGTKNIVQSPHIRQLARNFSLALSSYLHDPDMFRKDLEELRPTEPPLLNEVNNKDTEEAGGSIGDEELLNFSDTDTKSSFPPIYPTAAASSPSPTWGFILATKSTNDLDVKNSLAHDLNTADSQSFIPGYNNLNVVNSQKEDKKVVKDLPVDHWTTSPSATKLWKNTFSINPSIVNDHFDTTPLALEVESSESESIEPDNLPVIDQPHREIKYEVRTLPKVKLNSTQIHGILIDFMNTTSPDSDRLHRILRRLNTTEEEFLNKMKEIESNPLTKRLILLLISECGENAAKDIKALSSKESLEVSSSGSGLSSLTEDKSRANSYIPDLVDPTLSEDDHDTRALQLLNSLYSIASRFGK